ncbi:GIY-YIG nuclease family protein [Mucilaginibacter sp. L196]|uniref:GIY-YIG nuclease family protein n=1 Tax=Mucilaginibacter sp. L196 TaxID=1641870 RepID=UPI00131D252A|nr:GIY-YIG nuclease family protein [Mucilaginibacter sp. L196]
MDDAQYCIYIVTNKSNTTLYIGVTSNLQERIWQHKQKVYVGFTSRYDCDRLVYFEEYRFIQDAIAREKQLKGGSRQKKINLIVSKNPAWKDLSEDWYD